jgi:hypothetical protein
MSNTDLKNALAIKPFKVSAQKIESPPLMEKIGLKHPFSIGIFGVSGSGKTVLACQLLCSKNMYRHYFDEIHLFSPTAGADDTFKQLGLSDEYIHSTNMIEELEKLIGEQTIEVETHGILDSKKILILFDDLTSQKKLMNSEAFMKCSIQNRHINMSSIFICHKYNALIRTVRLNCGNLMIFPCSMSEKKIIMEEHQTPNLELNQFKKLIDYSFTKTKDNPKPFLWICLKADFDSRFRKNLYEILSDNYSTPPEQTETLSIDLNKIIQQLKSYNISV